MSLKVSSGMEFSISFHLSLIIPIEKQKKLKFRKNVTTQILYIDMKVQRHTET